MELQNSGPTYVYDAKTAEAIENAKNKLTLMDAETLRLAKLKKTLEGEIVRLEADIAYKVELNKEADKKALQDKEDAKKLQATLKDIEKHLYLVNKEFDIKTEAMQAREAEVAKREAAVFEREQVVEKAEKQVKDEIKHVQNEHQVLEEKKAKLAKAISEL